MNTRLVIFALVGVLFLGSFGFTQDVFGDHGSNCHPATDPDSCSWKELSTSTTCQLTFGVQDGLGNYVSYDWTVNPDGTKTCHVNLLSQSISANTILTIPPDVTLEIYGDFSRTLTVFGHIDNYGTIHQLNGDHTITLKGPDAVSKISNSGKIITNCHGFIDQRSHSGPYNPNWPVHSEPGSIAEERCNVSTAIKSGNWNDSSIWDHPPTNTGSKIIPEGKIVTIPQGITVTNSFPDGSEDTSLLSIQGTLINKGTLENISNHNLDATIEISGNLKNEGTLTTSGDIFINGGNLNNSGQLNNLDTTESSDEHFGLIKTSNAGFLQSSTPVTNDGYIHIQWNTIFKNPLTGEPPQVNGNGILDDEDSYSVNRTLNTETCELMNGSMNLNVPISVGSHGITENYSICTVSDFHLFESNEIVIPQGVMLQVREGRIFTVSGEIITIQPTNVYSDEYLSQGNYLRTEYGGILEIQQGSIEGSSCERIDPGTLIISPTGSVKNAGEVRNYGHIHNHGSLKNHQPSDLPTVGAKTIPSPGSVSVNNYYDEDLIGITNFDGFTKDCSSFWDDLKQSYVDKLSFDLDFTDPYTYLVKIPQIASDVATIASGPLGILKSAAVDATVVAINSVEFSKDQQKHSIGTINNEGQIHNISHLRNNGMILNAGTLYNTESGSIIQNDGTLMNKPLATLYNKDTDSSGTIITNHGLLFNSINAELLTDEDWDLNHVKNPYNLHHEASCEGIGGMWSEPNVCTIDELNVFAPFEVNQVNLKIVEGGLLLIADDFIVNEGVILNKGGIVVDKAKLTLNKEIIEESNSFWTSVKNNFGGKIVDTAIEKVIAQAGNKDVVNILKKASDKFGLSEEIKSEFGIEGSADENQAELISIVEQKLGLEELHDQADKAKAIVDYLKENHPEKIYGKAQDGLKDALFDSSDPLNPSLDFDSFFEAFPTPDKVKHQFGVILENESGEPQIESVLYNFGHLTINSGTLDNHGKVVSSKPITISGNLNQHFGASIFSYGSFDISNAVIDNPGQIAVFGDYFPPSPSQITGNTVKQKHSFTVDDKEDCYVVAGYWDNKNKVCHIENLSVPHGKSFYVSNAILDGLLEIPPNSSFGLLPTSHCFFNPNTCQNIEQNFVVSKTGVINNHGSLWNHHCEYCRDTEEGTFTNFGTINNYDRFVNSAEFVSWGNLTNFVDAEFSNRPGNFQGYSVPSTATIFSPMINEGTVFNVNAYNNELRIPSLSFIRGDGDITGKPPTIIPFVLNGIESCEAIGGEWEPRFVGTRGIYANAYCNVEDYSNDSGSTFIIERGPVEFQVEGHGLFVDDVAVTLLVNGILSNFGTIIDKSGFWTTDSGDILNCGTYSKNRTGAAPEMLSCSISANNGEQVCDAIHGIWDDSENSCISPDFEIQPNITFTVNSDITLDVDDGLYNHGTLLMKYHSSLLGTSNSDSDGQVIIEEGRLNFGLCNVMGGDWASNTCTIDNFENYSHDTLIVPTKTNLQINGVLTNEGTIIQEGTATVTGSITNSGSGSSFEDRTIITNKVSCEGFGSTFSWENKECVVSDYVLPNDSKLSVSDTTLRITGIFENQGIILILPTSVENGVANVMAGVINIEGTLKNIALTGGNHPNSGKIFNSGTLNVIGTLENEKLIVNDGTVNVSGNFVGVFDNWIGVTPEFTNNNHLKISGIFDNYGRLNNNNVIRVGTFDSDEIGTFNNHGQITNNESFRINSDSTFNDFGYKRPGTTSTSLTSFENLGSTFEVFGTYINHGSDVDGYHGILDNRYSLTIYPDGKFENHGEIKDNTGRSGSASAIYVRNNGSFENFGSIHLTMFISNYGSFTNDGSLNVVFLENSQEVPLTSFHDTLSISAIDSDTAFIAGGFDGVFRTNDGGDSWDAISMNSGEGMRYVTVANLNKAYLTTESGRFLKTNNGGDTWVWHNPSIAPNSGIDADQDGYVSTSGGGSDCDDNDDKINPGMPEIFGDAIDNDCDGILANAETLDLFVDDFIDSDGDGYPRPNENVAPGFGDCADTNNQLSPFGYPFSIENQGTPQETRIYDSSQLHPDTTFFGDTRLGDTTYKNTDWDCDGVDGNFNYPPRTILDVVSSSHSVCEDKLDGVWSYNPNPNNQFQFFCTIDGNVSWSRGIDITIGNDVRFFIQGDLSNNAHVVNNGRIDIVGTFTNHGQLINNQRIHVDSCVSGGGSHCPSNGNLINSFGQRGEIVNNGLITVYKDGKINNYWKFTNNEIIQVDPNTPDHRNDGKINNRQSGSFVNSPSGTIDVKQQFVNYGQLSNAGIINTTCPSTWSDCTSGHAQTIGGLFSTEPDATTRNSGTLICDNATCKNIGTLINKKSGDIQKINGGTFAYDRSGVGSGVINTVCTATISGLNPDKITGCLDTDGDKISYTVDTDIGLISTDFSDGTTSGIITSGAENLIVTSEDNQIKLVSFGDAEVSTCHDSTISLSGGISTFSCDDDSISLETQSGTAHLSFPMRDGFADVYLTPGKTFEFNFLTYVAHAVHGEIDLIFEGNLLRVLNDDQKIKYEPIIEKPTLANAISMVDSNTAYAVPSGSFVYKLVDGQWITQSIGDSIVNMWSVSAPNEQTAFAVGEGRTLVRSFDGGQTWDVTNINSVDLTGVSFTNNGELHNLRTLTNDALFVSVGDITNGFKILNYDNFRLEGILENSRLVSNSGLFTNLGFVNNIGTFENIGDYDGTLGNLENGCTGSVIGISDQHVTEICGDSDNDGMSDAVDLLPFEASNEFFDGVGTSTILSGADNLTITRGDAGINIVSVGPAEILACGISDVLLDAGEYEFFCGSITINVISGSATLEWLTDGIPTSVVIDAGESLTFDDTTLVVTTGPGTEVEVIIEGQDPFTISENSRVFLLDVTATQTIPDSPTIHTATGKNLRVELFWNPSTNNGGSEITDYVVEFNPDGTNWNVFDDGGGTVTEAIVNQLTNDVSYSFRVSTVNDVGQSLPSSIVFATPVAPANTSPISNPGGPYSVELGTSLTLDGSASTDPDTGDSITQYDWRILDSTGTTPLKAYTDANPVVSISDLQSLGVGDYLVDLTVTDSNGLISVIVTVPLTLTDTTLPTITAPSDDTVPTDSGIATAIVTFVITADDNSGSVTLTQTAGPASGDSFPMGTTTVTFTATDAAGNTSNASFTITVEDNEPPTIHLLDIDTLEATAEFTPLDLESFAYSATDNVDSNPTLDYSGPVNDLFPVGSTTVTWTATDNLENQSIETQTIIFEDNISPVITIPLDIPLEAPSDATLDITGTATATDLADPAPIISHVDDVSSLNLYGLGTITRTWTATDNSDNSVSAIQIITIQDTTSPVITEISGDFSVEATRIDGATVIYDHAKGSDNISVDKIECIPKSNTTFSISGESTTHTVTCTVTDVAGNTDQGVFDVTIRDTTKPKLLVPGPVSEEATGTNTPVTLGTATATDIFGVTITNDNTLTEFPVGTTTITYTATDGNGLITTATQTVTIVDTTAPVITDPPNITVEATGITTPVNIGTAYAYDIFPITLITSDSPFEFPIGETLVRWTAIDANGNYATTNTQIVTVVSPQITQSQIIDSLELLKIESSEKKTLKELDKMIKDLKKIIDEKYWQDDLVLDAKNGDKVFKEGDGAVHKLLKIIKEKKPKESPEFLAKIQLIIDRIILADRILAQAAIDYAEEQGGEKSDKEIDKANKEMNKAQDELDKGKPDKAIDKYKKAWEHAQKALKKKK